MNIYSPQNIRIYIYLLLSEIKLVLARKNSIFLTKRVVIPRLAQLHLRRYQYENEKYDLHLKLFLQLYSLYNLN